jgi:hypothetical protein
MKKKTVITTETREVWVIRQPFGVVEQRAPQDREREPTSECLTPNIDAKKTNDSSAESTTPDFQDTDSDDPTQRP